MGIYINKGNEEFRSTRNWEYVDKSGLIAVVNNTLFTRQRFSCVTRGRRFGKTMAAEMLYAYYDHSCDSRSLFADLEIARHPSFEEHLNKYPTIFLDLTRFTSLTDGTGMVENIERRLTEEIAEAYPGVPRKDGDDMMDFLLRIADTTGERFVFIIDEWDAPCRIFDPKTPAMDNYVNWLRRMFKDVTAMKAFAAVYMTGILPIKKYRTESALNNFTEYSMVKPGAMARYFGFTSEEVRMLAEKHDMDFDELEKWYDGYQIGSETSMFNPNSVMQAVREGWCESYWSATGSFEAIASYINMNYDGLKDDITELLAGGRTMVNPKGFLNDLSEIHSRDDVLTVLIHLAYLTYDRATQECYIPNMEVGGEMESAVKENRWEGVTEALKQSRRLVEATLRGDAEYVAACLDEAHTEHTSIFKFNDENSLSCVISIAYYYARNDFHFIRELPTGKGFADIVFLPRKNVSKPALVIELKNNKSTGAAIAQIKERRYPQQIEHYTGDMLLVGINYDGETKRHDCKIEPWRKE